MIPNSESDFKFGGIAATLLISVAFSYFGAVISAFAHGGEDHGDSKPATVNIGSGTEVRSVRIEDFEITLKNAPFVPDTELNARLFVTHFATNEPAQNVNIILTIEREGDKTTDIVAIATGTPGIFSVILTPIPEGSANLRVSLEFAGNVDNADLGEVIIASRVETSAAVTSWAQTAIYGLSALLTMALIAVIGWFVVRRWQLAQNDRDIEMQQKAVEV